MTREKALAVNWALLNLDGFEELAAEIREKVLDWEDTCHISPEFKAKLNVLLDDEFNRLKKILEDL